MRSLVKNNYSYNHEMTISYLLSAWLYLNNKCSLMKWWNCACH